MTVRFNPENERIKALYFTYLSSGAGKKSPKTVEQARKAIVDFEESTHYAPLVRLSQEQAIAYKSKLTSQKAKQSGELLSASTIRNRCKPLITFFQWLYWTSKVRTFFDFHDVEYLELSENEERANIRADYKEFPLIKALEKAVSSAPSETELEKRDRAIMAFVTVTGIRVEALCSLKLKDFDPVSGVLKQYAACGVKTKGRKNFTSTYFPVSKLCEDIVSDYVIFLRKEKSFIDSDPLFPITKKRMNEQGEFVSDILSKEHSSGTSMVNVAFSKLFQNIGVRSYNPHSVRDLLTQIAKDRKLTIDDFQAWSKNMGHAHMSTTLNNYGQKMSENEQIKILREMQHE